MTKTIAPPVPQHLSVTPSAERKTVRVGVFYNYRILDQVRELLRQAVVTLHACGARVVLDPFLGNDVPDGAEVVERDRIIGHCDVAVVLGGDGTLIEVGRMAADAGVPLLGVNLGTFGFLTEASPEQMETVLPRLVRGEYDCSVRLALECVLHPQGAGLLRSTAINDVYVTSRRQGRLIGLRLWVGDHPPIDFRADGLVVATPTGSTGHSLSAGGPILFPNVEGLVLTPVCAHTLASRPLVIPAGATVRIRAARAGDQLRVIVDGQSLHDPEPGFDVEVRKHPNGLFLVRDPARTFSETVRKKFYLGQTS